MAYLIVISQYVPEDSVIHILLAL